MGPQQNCLAVGDKVTDRGNQMCRPHPGARKQDDHVDLIIGFHFPKSTAGLFFGCEHSLMLNDPDPGSGKCLFRALHDRIVDKGRSHRIVESVLVNAVNDETDCRLNQWFLLTMVTTRLAGSWRTAAAGSAPSVRDSWRPIPVRAPPLCSLQPEL